MVRKKCNSCKRLLTYDCFGELRSSPDFYNPTCKSCRRFIRRESYKRKKEKIDKYADDMLPLRVHNFQSLKNELGEAELSPFNICGVDVNSMTQYQISFNNSKSIWELKISQNDNLIKGLLFPIAVPKDFLFDSLNEILFDLEIRVRILI
ncbi:hypothetical protein OAT67_04135 [Bacteriovoracaceae bacterium]|nr:hypothetical protein [Bacteriovoracaceae bacterium]